jgi:hypothetical protein
VGTLGVGATEEEAEEEVTGNEVVTHLLAVLHLMHQETIDRETNVLETILIVEEAAAAVEALAEEVQLLRPLELVSFLCSESSLPSPQLSTSRIYEHEKSYVITVVS